MSALSSSVQNKVKLVAALAPKFCLVCDDTKRFCDLKMASHSMRTVLTTFEGP